MEKFRNQNGYAIIKLIGIAFVSVLPLILMPYLSVVFILLICYTVLIITAVIRNYFTVRNKVQLLSLGGLGIVLFGFLIFVLIPDRIITFLSRGQNDPLGRGWQQIMADKWLESSIWFGKTDTLVDGYGLDMTIPGVTTDYVLINIIATFGWVIGIALIIVIALFVIRMFLTIRKVKNDYGFYLALSACLLISSQFLISILVNFNLFPAMSMSMPFVSYSNTNFVVSMALVGIILSVYRRNNLLASKPKMITGEKIK